MSQERVQEQDLSSINHESTETEDKNELVNHLFQANEPVDAACHHMFASPQQRTLTHGQVLNII